MHQTSFYPPKEIWGDSSVLLLVSLLKHYLMLSLDLRTCPLLFLSTRSYGHSSSVSLSAEALFWSATLIQVCSNQLGMGVSTFLVGMRTDIYSVMFPEYSRGMRVVL